MKSELELAEERRRRQYRTTSRVLREYTARLYRLTDRLAGSVDGTAVQPRDGIAPCAAISDIWRFAAIHLKIRELALFASQMMIHYALDEGEKAELALRIADVDQALDIARHYSVMFANLHNLDYPLRKAPTQTAAPANDAYWAERMPPRQGTLGAKPRP